MTLLDRYIFRSVLFTSALSVALLAFVLMLGNTIKDLLSYVLAGHLPLATFGRLVWLLAPAVATYALPMGVLAGVLLSLGRLSADSEVVAMRAAGMSLSRVARPVIIFAIVGSLVALYVNFSSMPRARVEYHKLLAEAIRADPLRIIQPKTFIRDFPGYVVFVEAKNGAIVRDFWLMELDDKGRMVRSLHAPEGRFDLDMEANELVLTFSRATIEMRDPKSPENFDLTWTPTVETRPIRLPLAKIFGVQTDERKAKWMTWTELKVELERYTSPAGTSEGETARVKEEMQVRLTIHDKFTTAFAVLSFALVGVPLGIKVSRRETSANLGVAVILALSYYMLTVMVMWLENRPDLRPDLLLWLPNVLFAAVGIWLFRRIDKR